MNNILKVDNTYLLWHLEQALSEFVHHYYHERCHESLSNVTPSDMYHGRAPQIQSRRERIKEKKMRARRRLIRQQLEEL